MFHSRLIYLKASYKKLCNKWIKYLAVSSIFKQHKSGNVNCPHENKGNDGLYNFSLLDFQEKKSEPGPGFEPRISRSLAWRS